MQDYCAYLSVCGSRQHILMVMVLDVMTDAMLDVKATNDFQHIGMWFVLALDERPQATSMMLC